MEDLVDYNQMFSFFYSAFIYCISVLLFDSYLKITLALLQYVVNHAILIVETVRQSISLHLGTNFFILVES